MFLLNGDHETFTCEGLVRCWLSLKTISVQGLLLYCVLDMLSFSTQLPMNCFNAVFDCPKSLVDFEGSLVSIRQFCLNYLGHALRKYPA